MVARRRMTKKDLKAIVDSHNSNPILDELNARRARDAEVEMRQMTPENKAAAQQDLEEQT